MSPTYWLIIYCLLILLASIGGGLLPVYIRLTHRRMELTLSFVSGVMLGIGLLHLLPHAWAERALALANDSSSPNYDPADIHTLVEPVLLWMLGGFLVMFLVERFFSFHQHPVELMAGSSGSMDSGEHAAGSCDDHHHGHEITWKGAVIGLSLHSLLAGMALAGSLEAGVNEGRNAALAGFGTFLVIFLHKPFDALAIGTLMARGNRFLRAKHLVNALFALVIPLGAALMYLGLRLEGASGHALISVILAFSAGMFLCIALSDLLPELQFHQHDRVKLSAALLLGLALAWGVAKLESGGHGPDIDNHTELIEGVIPDGG